jgi:hypothetical protein
MPNPVPRTILPANHPATIPTRMMTNRLSFDICIWSPRILFRNSASRGPSIGNGPYHHSSSSTIAFGQAHFKAMNVCNGWKAEIIGHFTCGRKSDQRAVKQLATDGRKRRNPRYGVAGRQPFYRAPMTPLQMYIERAAECRREADSANLANVRDRCLGSALAWESMADRAEQTEIYRVNEVQRKVEQGRRP